MKTGKIWGFTEILLATPFIEVHRLSIIANSHCSLHCHKNKWNAFFVQSGELKIEVHKADYDLVDVTVLKPGEFTTVEPGEFHRFLTDCNPVSAIEIYYPAPLAEDIVRKTVGGASSPVSA